MQETGFIPRSGRCPGEGMDYPLQYSWASLVAQMVKNLPAMQETWVQALGGEDPLEKEMAIHSSLLAWEIPWTEEPGGLQSIGWQRICHYWWTKHRHMHEYQEVRIMGVTLDSVLHYGEAKAIPGMERCQHDWSTMRKEDLQNFQGWERRMPESLSPYSK